MLVGKTDFVAHRSLPYHCTPSSAGARSSLNLFFFVRLTHSAQDSVSCHPVRVRLPSSHRRQSWYTSILVTVTLDVLSGDYIQLTYYLAVPRSSPSARTRATFQYRTM